MPVIYVAKTSSYARRITFVLGQTLEPWLLKKSLGNAVERKQFSGLPVEIIKDHAVFQPSVLKRT